MLNEFRQGMISGEWVLFATGRAKGHLGEKREKLNQPKEECPFENPFASNGEPVVVFNQGSVVQWAPGKAWTTVVIPNKYPALQHGICGDLLNVGPFQKAEAYGFHEIVITKDHDRHFAHFSNGETAEVLSAYQHRYEAMVKDSCGKYVLVFHNHGSSAGATIYHNHSQILSLPFIPPGIATSLGSANDYYHRLGKSIFEVMLDWEIKEGKRIVYQNELFVVFCPFASRTPYELRIFPLKDDTQFGSLSPEQVTLLADALNQILKKLDKCLDDPDYNFYIHSRPIGHDPVHQADYRWHIEVVPRLSVIASVELGTNVYVNVVDPDEAAQALRNTVIE